MPLERNVSNRRSFLTHTVGLAAPTFLAHQSAYPALGKNTSNRSSTSVVAARKASNIRIGIRIHQGWLDSKNDNDPEAHLTNSSNTNTFASLKKRYRAEFE